MEKIFYFDGLGVRPSLLSEENVQWLALHNPRAIYFFAKAE